MKKLQVSLIVVNLCVLVLLIWTLHRVKQSIVAIDSTATTTSVATTTVSVLEEKAKCEASGNKFKISPNRDGFYYGDYADSYDFTCYTPLKIINTLTVESQ